jgi:predicted RecB family nuclease
MKVVDGRMRLSATDLANFGGCRRLTFLDQELARGRIAKPRFRDPTLETLAQRGDQHEAAYLTHLRGLGKRVEKLEPQPIADNVTRVLELMREGADVIAQAAMVHGGWLGYADFLVRVELPEGVRSKLGGHAYEAQDTKLAHTTKGSAVLQLALYSDILETMQGYRPTHMTVVSPGEGGGGVWAPRPG